MEVGLLREGIRCLFFVGLCVCFATAFFLSTQPTHRAESRWYLDKRLDVEQMRDVTDPQSLFKAIMHVSSRVRDLVPTSSEYVDEPLSKVWRPFSCPIITTQLLHDMPQHRHCLWLKQAPTGSSTASVPLLHPTLLKPLCPPPPLPSPPRS